MAVTGIGNSPEVAEIQQPDEPAKPQETPKPETPAIPQAEAPATPEKPNEAVAEKTGIDRTRLKAFDVAQTFGNRDLRASLGEAVSKYQRDGKVSPAAAEKVAEQMSRQKIPLIVDFKDFKAEGTGIKLFDGSKD